MKLVINEYEAEAVRLIYKMYLEGEGYTSIIETLNSNGYRTKRGALFGKNSLYEILRNEKYSGVYIYNKSASKNADGKFNRHQSKNADEIIKIDDGVPQIISKEDFEKVQKKMMERKRKTASFKAKQEYLLTGKIFCGECGCTYAGNSRKASNTHPLYISYRCTKKNGAIKCKNPEVQRNWIENVVITKLADNVFNEKMLPKLLEQYNSYALSKNRALTTNISAIKSKLSETEKNIDNIVNVVMQTGSVALNNKLKELEDNKAQLEMALLEAQNKLSEMSISENQLKRAFKKAKQMLLCATLKNRKAIIDQYVNKITIYKDTIAIEFNISSEFKVEENISR